MIDFLLGCIVTSAIAFLIHHFGPQATKAFALNLEIRIKTMVTEAANAIIAEIQALPGQYANQPNAALAAEQQNHADDLSAIDAAVKAAAPAPVEGQ